VKTLKIALVTCPDKESSEQIARSLVTDRLAACVNIINGVRSIYTWKEKIEDEQEYLLIIKTSARQVAALEAAVVKLHPYDTPEFVVLDTAHVNEKYMKWILDQT